MISSHCEYNLLAANLSIWEDRSRVGDSLLGRWRGRWRVWGDLRRGFEAKQEAGWTGVVDRYLHDRLSP
jgi:hypothetical protein